MFGSVRFSGWRMTIFSLLCLLVFLGICMLALSAAAPDTVIIGGEAYPLSAEDDAAVIDFIARCGYEVTAQVSDSTVTVPKNWNKMYEDYNELQLRQGLDLVPYKGREARRTVYSLKDGGYAEVLTAGGRIIAAHLSDMLPGSKPSELIDP